MLGIFARKSQADASLELTAALLLLFGFNYLLVLHNVIFQIFVNIRTLCAFNRKEL